MKILFVVLSLGTWVTPLMSAEVTKPIATLRVMTFNLRYASDRPPNEWSARRPVMRALIEKAGPDLLGTQEGLFRQLKDLTVDLPGYQWIGLGREGGSHGEFMAIFYRRERFEPLEFDHFWLSDTPSVIGSSTWGNSNRRMVTWVRFKDRPNNQEFYLFNTHFDHEIQAAREKSAALLRQRIMEIKTELPIIVTGDFNASAGKNKTYDLLVEGDYLRDIWTSAPDRKGPVIDTFHDFRGPRTGDDRIDWILVRGPVKPTSIQIDTFSSNGQFPSDHFPVVADLEFESGGSASPSP